jgi:hypothetical protein
VAGSVAAGVGSFVSLLKVSLAQRFEVMQIERGVVAGA